MKLKTNEVIPYEIENHPYALNSVVCWPSGPAWVREQS